MNNSINIVLVFLLNVCFINFSSGQNQQNKKKFYQKDFDKNKVLEDVYELRIYKNRWTPIDKDTISYFVDTRSYKGIINYGVEFKSKNYESFNFIEDVAMYYLNVEFEKCTFTPNDSIIEIQGFVSGGWGNKKGRDKKIENTIDIFLGNKRDTVSYHYFKNVADTSTVETTFNNQIVKDYVVLDSFPSFYFKKYSHYLTNSQEKRPFKIKGKINKNSTLAFGGRACYSEVFDIGAMVFKPEKNNKNIPQKKEIGFKQLIFNNELINDSQKEDQDSKLSVYYLFTKRAEDFILRGQYAKAKEEYLLLDKEYPVLFARDIHNAVRCGVLSRDYKNAFYWGEKLAPKGVPIKYFNASVFTVLKRNPGWKNFTVRYDSIYKESLEKFNKNLKTQIEALTEEDQADYGLANRKEPKVLYETTVRVTDKLIELLRKEGYPSEEKIGVYTKNDSTLLFYPDYNVLITHAWQKKVENLNDLDKLLVKFGENLEYDYKRNRLKSGINNSCFHVYKGNLYNSKSCSNNNEGMVRKMKFMFNNPHNFIFYNNEYDVIPYEKAIEKERDEYYKENYNFVMKLTDDWFFYEK
ncbi:hypothetical protein [Flavobacterium jejuense]|uniref:hypothetical protein n=1 Tax=Flavobacterium jejuense TaxID=1544455 RepID=UPI001AA0A845|nr:hypothetical protein [Flavobacterium jejuense]